MIKVNLVAGRRGNFQPRLVEFRQKREPPDKKLVVMVVCFALLVVIAAGSFYMWMTEPKVRTASLEELAVVEVPEPSVNPAEPEPDTPTPSVDLLEPEPDAPAPAVVEEYRHFGEGFATKDIGLKVWLDPLKTSADCSAPARYILEGHTDVFFEDPCKNISGEELRRWWKFPAGNYLVYPAKGNEIYFHWWQ